MARPKGSTSKTWPLIRFRPSTPFHPWMVDCGMMDGKRVRFAFATKEAAEGKATLMRAQRRGEGETSFSISSKFDRVDAEAAIDLLKPHKVTLLQAAEFYIQNIAVIRDQKPVNVVVDELLKFKTQDGRAARYIKDLEFKLRRAFAIDECFNNRPIHEITVRDRLRSNAVTHSKILPPNWRMPM